jgi:molybdenum cofactor cytidylyltransferase
MSAVGLMVLAAGASSRLGEPKQLVQYGGQSLLRRMAEAALGSGCRPVVVVVGAQPTRMRHELHGLPVQIADNAQWESGMASSIQVGLRALPHGLDGVLVMLCDQPQVTSAILDSLVAAWEGSGAPLAACEYGGALGVPALFAAVLRPELDSLRGAEGAKRLLQRYRAQAVSLPFPGGALDIDTPEDLKRLLAG